MDSRHQILIFESIKIIEESLRATLENKHFQVVGLTGNWSELFSLAGSMKPDLILLDLTSNPGESIEYLRNLKEDHPDISLLVMSSEEFSGYFTDLFIMGVNGIIYGTVSSGELKEAIRKIIDGQDYFPDEIISILKDSMQFLNHSGKTVHKWGTPLTARETAVLLQFCRGMTYKEIGNHLNISPRTVESHKKNILSKLNIGSTAEMVTYAIHHHLI